MAMDQRWWDPELGKEREKEYHHFVEDVFKESDRGCIISAVSYLEILIERISKERLGKRTSAKELIGSEGPLGGFVNRCKLCFSLDLISENEFLALQQAARIRNKFAHRLFAKIDDHSFRDQLKVLKKHLSNEVHPREFQGIAKDNHRGHFTNCISILASRLLHRELLVAEMKQQETIDIPNWHNELIEMTGAEKSKNDP